MAEQSTQNKVVKSISSQTLITILTGFVEIASFSVMSRLLTQQDFGYYAAVTAVSTIFASFSDAGIGSAIVQRKNIDQRYIDNAFTLSLFFGLFGASLLVSFAGVAARIVADASMRIPLMLIAITLLTGTLSSVNFSIMQRRLQFLRMGIIRISALIVTTIVSIILAIKGFGYYAIIAKVILYSLITLIVSFAAARTKYHLAFDIRVYKEIFGFGGWLMASAFFRKIAEQIDRLSMSSMFSVTILGLYSRPKDFIYTMTSKVCDILDSSLFPILSAIQDEKVKLIRSYQYSLYYFNLVGIMISLAFMYNSELIIRIFLGVEWLNINHLFIVLSLSGVCMMNGMLGDIYLRTLAFTKQQFYLRIFQSALSIVLIITVARFGILAVAFAYLVAYGIVVIVKMHYISRKIEYRLKEAVFQVLKSYKVAIVYVPLYLVMFCLFPNTLIFNLVKLIAFVVISIVLFLLFPRMVGDKYKAEIHNKISDLYLRKIYRK